jgi:hypothetical protein
MSKISIDFKSIAEKMGIRSGNIHIFRSPAFGWVAEGGECHLECIDPPEGTVRIEDNCWITEEKP